MKKVIISRIIALLLVLSMVVCFTACGGDKDSKVAQVSVDVSVLNAGENLSSSASSLISGLTEGVIPENAISGVVTGFLYSDSVINMIMSIAYPLLYNVLMELNMLDFAEKVSLYPTGPQLAGLLADSSYTCFDKDGTQKKLTEVLENVGSDWTYMDSTVSVTSAEGAVKNEKLWNTIAWGVSDEDSFFKALTEMSMGLRGVLEICLQNKSCVVNVNVLEVLLKKEVSIPLNMDAAKVFNASEEQGYEKCLISLFNMLGLAEGEYVSSQQFGEYTEIEDMWRALLLPVVAAVKKIEADALPLLTDLLVNFVNAIDSGELVENLRSLRMDADFNPLASLFMGYKDGLLHNLGDSLISTIEALGIKITGSFNELLDSLGKTLFKDESFDLPDMDTGKLMSLATAETLPNGNTHYASDSEKVADFLVEYICSAETIKALLSKTELANNGDVNALADAIGSNRAGVVAIVNALLAAVTNAQAGK